MLWFVWKPTRVVEVKACGSMSFLELNSSLVNLSHLSIRFTSNFPLFSFLFSISHHISFALVPATLSQRNPAGEHFVEKPSPIVSKHFCNGC